jgi:tripartite-type tricarboxylate transporter receptor subunit TctC
MAFRCWYGLLAVAGLQCCARPVYPNRPLRIIVPYPPGASVDSPRD